jgi:hypothetical protein
VRFEYAASDYNDPVEGKQTFTDNSGVLDLGLGFIFFRDRLAIQPTIQKPFAADNNDLSYGVVFSIGWAVKR